MSTPELEVAVRDPIQRDDLAVSFDHCGRPNVVVPAVSHNDLCTARHVKRLEIEQAKTARLSRIHSVLSGTNSAISC
jgi:hypothetical protein